jgi:tyrosyl-tRNA synthetase
VASSSQARRKIREGAVKINQETVHNELRVIDASTFGRDHHLIVSLGRKQKFAVHKRTPSQKGV